MKVLNTKILIVILLIGLLSACGTQPTEASASPPTEEAVPATEAPVATDTSAPAEPTEEPAATTDAPASTTGVSFANDVLPILQSRCLNCHGGDRLEEGLSVKTYAELMAGSENGLVITPGDAGNSLLVELVSTQKMPKRGPKLTPPQVQLIIDWINQGALDN
jgi:mono/diheme cytochrome c family protein